MSKIEIGATVKVKSTGKYGKVVGYYNKTIVIVVPTKGSHTFLWLSGEKLELPELVWTDYPDWEE